MSKQRILSSHLPAPGVWAESTHFTPQYSPLSHASFKYCHLLTLSSFMPICISVMWTCTEPQAWTASQTSPFEIIPVLGSSCVCGHSPQDRWTLLTEFRWAQCSKSLHLSSIPSVWSGKWALRLPHQISQAAIHCQRWQHRIFQRNRWPVSVVENESLRGYSVSTVYSIGNTEHIVWLSATRLWTSRF